MKRWYLLYCKRGEQARAKMHLENQGLECYYPEVEIEKILRGKRQKVKEPLFPSYVFVHFDYEQGPSFTTVRSTRGVVDFIRFGAHPQEVDSALIDELEKLATHPEEPETDALPKQGEKIRVTGGQFAGIDAIFQEADGEARSIMLVKMINRPVQVSIDNKDLDI